MSTPSSVARVPTITHKLFVDDSGNKEYDPAGTYVGKGRTPYFVFGGLIVRPEDAGKISAAMESLKLEAFGDPDVEIKANWLKQPGERKKRYIEPYGVTDAKLDRLSDALYQLICDQKCELVACAVSWLLIRRAHTWGRRTVTATTRFAGCCRRCPSLPRKRTFRFASLHT